MTAILTAIWKQIAALNRSKITHGITLAFSASIAVLVLLNQSMTLGTKWEVEIGLLVATLTRFQFLWQRVVPLLDGSSVVQVSPPAVGTVSSLVSVAADPRALPKVDVIQQPDTTSAKVAAAIVASSREKEKGSIALSWRLAVGMLAILLAISALVCVLGAGCKTTPVKPDGFFGRVVTCAETNPANEGAVTAVLGCLQGSAYVACLAGLGLTWGYDEIACIVRSYAMGAAARLNAGTAAGNDAAALTNANDWLRSEQIRF